MEMQEKILTSLALLQISVDFHYLFPVHIIFTVASKQLLEDLKRYLKKTAVSLLYRKLCKFAIVGAGITQVYSGICSKIVTTLANIAYLTINSGR